jgi:hypothetical protein
MAAQVRLVGEGHRGLTVPRCLDLLVQRADHPVGIEVGDGDRGFGDLVELLGECLEVHRHVHLGVDLEAPHEDVRVLLVRARSTRETAARTTVQVTAP